MPEQRVAASTFHRYSRGLRLAIPQADARPIPISLRCRSTCCNHEARGLPIGVLHSRDSLAENLVSRISVRKTSHMSIQPQLALTDYAGNKSHPSLSQQPLVGHKIGPAIAKDSPKRPGAKGIKSPSQILGQSPSLASTEQEWKHKGPEDSDFRPPAQVSAAPHPMIQ